MNTTTKQLEKMTIPELTAKRLELDQEYDSLTEKIQAIKRDLIEKHGYSVRDVYETSMMSTAARSQFDRQTEIEEEIKRLDAIAEKIFSSDKNYSNI